MARIFISYSSRDKKLVSEYVPLLQEYGHEILMDETLLTPGSNFQETLLRELDNADGTIVFLTENAIQSSNVSSEIGIARANVDKRGKFLIPLVSGKVQLPYTIQDIMYVQLDNTVPAEAIRLIHNTIQNHQNQSNKKASSPSHTSSNLTPSLFTTTLYKFLSELPRGTTIGDWFFKGKTDIVFGTPAGGWEADGFLFESSGYAFVVRSISDAGGKGELSYLVIESLNLEGQLVNHALDSHEKFSNENGIVTIREAYDMTVGLGRRARKDVQQAFEMVGFNSNAIITSFYESEVDWAKIILDILDWAIFREKAKRILANKGEPAPATSAPENAYWFLKIYGHNWDLPDITEGLACYFHAWFTPNNKRPDYEHFSAMSVGDKGMAYDFSSGKAIVFLFEVTQRLARDERQDELVRFKVTNKLERTLPLERFVMLIDFGNEIMGESPRVLFPLLKELYDQLVHLIEQTNMDDMPLLNIGGNTLSQVAPDLPSRDLKDQLGFENDVAALASIIAYKEAGPPLAVGLFGNWGTGKSFFINKLQAGVDKLTEDKSGVFCKKVLQINFNSWHYSDSNLWASLITKIFEDIQEYGKGRPKELENLFSQLNSNKERLSEAENEQHKITQQVIALGEKKKLFDEEIEKKAQGLKPLNLIEISKAVFSDALVKQDAANLEKEYGFIKLKEYQDIDQNIQALRTTSDKFVESLKLVYSFRQGKGWRALAVAVLVGAAIYWLIRNVGTMKDMFAGYKLLIYTISTAFVQVMFFLKPAIKLVNQGFVRLQSFKQTYDGLREKAKERFEEDKRKLEHELKLEQDKADAVQQKIALLKIEQQKLSTDIEDIASGKKIIRFIEGRVTDERYINSLGIISWIRKDFEQLNALLCQQKESQGSMDQLATNAKAFELERIILYIDDLDRCPEQLVVKVLEAIHLLLAFELFIVVVGVDPRWVHNALNKQYPHLLPAGWQQEAPEKQVHKDAFAATSYDYLEKIFQIPFALKPMNEEGKSKLIESQLEKKNAPTVVPPPPSPVPLPNAPVPPDPAPVAPPPPPAPVPNSPATPNPDQPAPNGPKEEGNQPASPEKLQVSAEEISFMKDIAFIIGSSPRTIKRYINIYRIVRTHSGFKYQKNNETDYYFAAMFLLSIITGITDEARPIFKLIKSADADTTIKELLKGWPGTLPIGLQQLSEKIEKRGTAGLTVFGSIELKKFKANMELISRFSFRDVYGGYTVEKGSG